MTEYTAAYWPGEGEMILLLQGIDPWSGEYSQEQAQWLKLAAPYMNIPMLMRHYKGPTKVGRSFSAAALAHKAGGSIRQAFRDAWLGRHKEITGRRVYEARWRNRNSPKINW